MTPSLTPVAGQTVRLTIEDIAFGGEGVGRMDDFVVFVPFVAPGEVVEAELTEVKKRFARARLPPIIPCPQPYGYRNRIMIRSQWDKYKQGLNIGFIRADSRLVVDIEECKIAEPALSQQIGQV